MTCEEARKLVGAYVDAQLDAAQRAEVAAHLASCDACKAEQSAILALRLAVARVPRFEAPAAPATRIAASLPLRRRFPFQMVLAFAAGAAAMQLALFVLRLPGAGRAALVDTLVTAHVRSLASGRLVQVASSDRHTVKPWFNGQVDTAPTPVELASEGFPLLGGRIDTVNGRPTAVLVYGRRLHRLNVFELPAERDEGFWEADKNGFHVIGWASRGLESIAVSDVDVTDMRRFARLLREGG